MRSVFFLLLLAGVALALITVPPMYGDFRIARWSVEGPGFVAVVGIDDALRNVTLFTEEGYELWKKDMPGTAVFNGMLRRDDVLIIETPPGRYVLAIYPLPFVGGRTQTYVSSYSGWAPVGVMSLPREPTAFRAAAGYFEIHKLKARNEGEVKDGASVQLNTMVVLELADGGRQYYFVQNILALRTDEGRHSFVVNIFNDTSKSGSFTGEIEGRGKIYWHIAALSYYGYRTREERLSLPLAGFLLINVTAAGGTSESTSATTSVAASCGTTR